MSNLLPNEPELLQRLIDGDAEAFRSVYEHYQGKVFLFAFRFTKSHSQAEETVQEVFIKLWERRMLVDPAKRLEPYIITITKNFLLDGLKKAALDRGLQHKLYEQMQALQHHSVDELIAKEIARLQQQAVDNLSGQQKRFTCSVGRKN